MSTNKDFRTDKLCRFISIIMSRVFIFYWVMTMVPLSAAISRPALNVSFSFIDVPLHSSLSLRCTGSSPLSWTFQDPMRKLDNHCRETSGNFSSSLQEHFSSVEGNVEYVSDIRLNFHSSKDTGSYVCSDSGDPPNTASLYVFVNDPVHLLLSSSSDVKSCSLDISQGKHFNIPCLPTNSEAKVSLWRTPYELVQVNDTLRFSPREGFTLRYPSNYYHGEFYCKAIFKITIDRLDLHLNFTQPRVKTVRGFTSSVDQSKLPIEGGRIEPKSSPITTSNISHQFPVADALKQTGGDFNPSAKPDEDKGVPAEQKSSSTILPTIFFIYPDAPASIPLTSGQIAIITASVGIPLILLLLLIGKCIYDKKMEQRRQRLFKELIHNQLKISQNKISRSNHAMSVYNREELLPYDPRLYCRDGMKPESNDAPENPISTSPTPTGAPEFQNMFQ